MRRAGLALLITLGLVQPSVASDPWTPDAKLIAKIEAAMHIPDSSGDGSPSVRKYARYYTGKTEGGRHIIEGLLLLPPAASARPGVYIVSGNKMPLGIQDGGCTEVRLQYDVAASKFLFVRCNGLA